MNVVTVLNRGSWERDQGTAGCAAVAQPKLGSGSGYRGRRRRLVPAMVVGAGRYRNGSSGCKKVRMVRAAVAKGSGCGARAAGLSQGSVVHGQLAGAGGGSGYSGGTGDSGLR